VNNPVWSSTIVWDTNIVWDTRVATVLAANIVWADAATWAARIVWPDRVVGEMDGDNIVWGTAGGGDNIVWGTGARGDNIVWGTSDSGDNIVWGTYSGRDNIVWGTSDTGAAVLFDLTVNQPVNWATLPHLFARMSDEQIFGFIVAMTSPAPYIGGIPPAPPADGPPPAGDSGMLPPPDPLPVDLPLPVEPFDPSSLPSVEPMNLDLLPPPVAPVLGGL